jgi:hypothetical protein
LRGLVFHAKKNNVGEIPKKEFPNLFKLLKNYNNGDVITVEEYTEMELFFNSPFYNIAKTFCDYSRFEFLEYFSDKIKHLKMNDYSPSTQDILRVPKKNNTVSELSFCCKSDFSIEKNIFLNNFLF